VADQSQLHGLLAKIRDLGATLIAVTSEASAPQVRPELLWRKDVTGSSPTLAAPRRRSPGNADADPLTSGQTRSAFDVM
jgi:hypothetical protein